MKTYFPSKTIKPLLILSTFGDNLFRASIMIFLLQLGYSGFEAASALALTALPNLVLGPLLGRVVDRSHHTKLFLGLSLILALLEIIILACAGWFPNLSLRGALPVAMVIFATAYSTLATLVYQYFIPRLAQDEQSAFTQWAIISSATAVLAGIFAFFALAKVDAGWLIIFDACTFITCGIAVASIVHFERSELSKEKSRGEEYPDSKIAFSLKTIFSQPQLLSAAAGMWIFALIINSYTNNVSVLGYKVFSFEGRWLALSGVGMSALGWLGAKGYKYLPSNLRSKHSLMQQVSLVAAIPSLLLLASAVAISSAWMGVLAMALFAFLDPFWCINNNLLLRRMIPEGHYGEVFGYIRVPRALATMAGTAAIGGLQDVGHTSTGCLLGAGLIIAFILVSRLTGTEEKTFDSLVKKI